MEGKEKTENPKREKLVKLYQKIGKNPYSGEVWQETVKLAKEGGLQSEGGVPLEELINIGQKVGDTNSVEEKQKLLLQQSSTGEYWYDVFLGEGNKTMFEPIRELLSKEIKNRSTKFEKGLEVGSGTGNILRSMEPYFEKIIGVDVSEDMLEVARKKGLPENVKVVVGGAENLPFEEEGFDRVVSNGLTHYLSTEQVRKFALELKRVLKKGGIYMEAYPIKESEESIPEISKTVVDSARNLLVHNIASMFIYAERETKPPGLKGQVDIFLSVGFDIDILGPLKHNAYVVKYIKK